MPRILVIDDQPHVRATISLALQAKGYTVVSCDNGSNGLIEFDNGNFDIAIVDIFMPGLDGAKLIKMMRSRRPDLPIIAISGVLMKRSGRTALDFLSMSPDLSSVVCLPKPFKPSELLMAIERATAAVRAA